jgi:hypothetical protein
MSINKSKFDPAKFLGAGKRYRADRRVGEKGGQAPVSSEGAFPDTHNNLPVHHIIMAIRILAALYSDAADMLDAQLEKASLGPRAASLDPADFIHEEDDAA